MMGSLAKKAALSLIFLFLLPIHAGAQSLTDACGSGGCSFATYSGLAPSTPGSLSPGLTGSSLAMAGPKASALYQIAGARQLDIKLYSTGGTVASFSSTYQDGAWVQGAEGSRFQQIYWEEAGHRAFLADGSTLQIDPNSGSSVFFPGGTPGRSDEYLGVNVSVSTDGSTFRPVEASLVSAARTGRAWHEHYQARLSDNVQWVRVSLRDYQKLPIYGKNNKTRTASSQLQLEEVTFTGTELLTGGQQPKPPPQPDPNPPPPQPDPNPPPPQPDPDPPEPPPSSSSSSSPSLPPAPSTSLPPPLPPPPDIAGWDTVGDGAYADDQEPEEKPEKKSEKKPEKEELPSTKKPTSASSAAPKSGRSAAPKAGGGNSQPPVLDSSHAPLPGEEEPPPQEEPPLENLPQPAATRDRKGDWLAVVAAITVAGASAFLYRITRRR